MKMLCTAGIAALLVAAGPALAEDAGAKVKLSQAECQNIWSRADAAGSGSLSSADAQGYVKDFSAVDADADGALSSSEFMAGCEKGLIHDSASTGAGEGASGAGPLPRTREY